MSAVIVYYVNSCFVQSKHVSFCRGGGYTSNGSILEWEYADIGWITAISKQCHFAHSPSYARCISALLFAARFVFRISRIPYARHNAPQNASNAIQLLCNFWTAIEPCKRVWSNGTGGFKMPAARLWEERERRHNKIVICCCGSCGLWRESHRERECERKRHGETGWLAILANNFIMCGVNMIFIKTKCWNAWRRQFIAV